MRVKVKTFATLREIMGREADLDLADHTTVGELLDRLCREHKGLREEIYGPDGKLLKLVNILKNGRNVYFLKDMETELEDGDIIALFPPVAGG
jgi:molybdopterin synthase sulfur carrier subunit